MEKDFQANGTQKQAEVTIFMSDKAYFKPKLLKRNKECHFILIKGSICQVDITILNITILYIYIYIYKCWCNKFHKTDTTEHKNADRL
jgi:hypothetical protein